MGRKHLSSRARPSVSFSARLQPAFYRHTEKNGPVALQAALNSLDSCLQTSAGQAQYLHYLQSRIHSLYSRLGLHPDFELDGRTCLEVKSRLSRLRIVWSPASSFSFASLSPSQYDRYLFSRYGAFARLLMLRAKSAGRSPFSNSDETLLRLCALRDLEHELLHVSSALYYTPYLGRRGWLARTLYAPVQMVRDFSTHNRLFSNQADFEQILGEDPAFALEEGMTALLSPRARIYLSFQSSILRQVRALPIRERAPALGKLLRTWLNVSDPNEAQKAYAFVKEALARKRK